MASTPEFGRTALALQELDDARINLIRLRHRGDVKGTGYYPCLKSRHTRLGPPQYFLGVVEQLVVAQKKQRRRSDFPEFSGGNHRRPDCVWPHLPVECDERYEIRPLSLFR